MAKAVKKQAVNKSAGNNTEEITPAESGSQNAPTAEGSGSDQETIEQPVTKPEVSLVLANGEKLGVGVIVKIEELKKIHLKVVEENPIIEIIDNKTYEAAKKNRTALLTRSTTTEKEGKTVKSTIKNLGDNVWDKYAEISAITRTRHDVQQSIIDVWEDKVKEEKARKEREAAEREERIKGSIETIKTNLTERIRTMTYDNRVAEYQDISAELKSHVDTFEEFSIFYDLAKDDITEKLDARIDTLDQEHEQAETKRKQAHESALTNFENSFMKLILDMTFENKEEKAKEATALIDNYNKSEAWEEFQNRYTDKKDEFFKKFDQRTQEVKEAESNRKQQKQNDRDLKQFREEKVYNNRSPRLIELGMVAVENGDHELRDEMTYTREQIVTDSDEVFEKTLQNIETRQEIYAKKQEGTPQAPESPALPAQEIPEVNIEAANVNEIEVKIDEPKHIGKPETVGELREILKDFSDETPLNFRNMPILNLFEMQTELGKIVYFTE